MPKNSQEIDASLVDSQNKEILTDAVESKNEILESVEISEEINESQDMAQLNNSIQEFISFDDQPDEIIMNILRAAKTPKELLQNYSRLSTKIRRLVFDKTLWEEYVPSELKQNQYSPKVYQFFARAYYFPFCQKIIQEQMADPQKFDQELRRWTEPGEEGFPEVNPHIGKIISYEDLDENTGIFPFLLGCEKAQEYFRWLLKVSCYGIKDKQWEAILVYGDKKLLEELVNLRPEDSKLIQGILFVVAAQGNLFAQMKSIWTKASLEQQQYLLEFVYGSAFREAAKNGHLHIIEWLWMQITEERKAELLRTFSTSSIAYSGHLNILTWFWENISEKRKKNILNSDFFKAAISSGNFQMVQWLWAKFSVSVKNKIMEFLSQKMFERAAKSGNLDTLKWFWTLAIQAGNPIDLSDAYYHSFYLAAQTGHLEVLEWLWQQETQGQQPEILPQLLGSVNLARHYTTDRNNGYPIDSQQDKLRTASYTDPRILRWLWEHATEKQRPLIGEAAGLDALSLAAILKIEVQQTNLGEESEDDIQYQTHYSDDEGIDREFPSDDEVIPQPQLDFLEADDKNNDPAISTDSSVDLQMVRNARMKFFANAPREPEPRPFIEIIEIKETRPVDITDIQEPENVSKSEQDPDLTFKHTFEKRH